MGLFLTPSDRASLQLRHRQEKDRRVAYRLNAVLLADSGWSYTEISAALLLDEETISRHVTEYKRFRKLDISSGGSESKLDALQTAELIAYLEENTQAKTSIICAYVKEKYGITYSFQGMYSWLKHNDFSYKQPRPVPAKADAEQQAGFIEFYTALGKNTPEDEPILFCDGVHPTMATKISCGWIRKGKDKLIETTGSRTRMNLMGALNLENMGIVIEAFDTINSEAMERFFATTRAAYPDAAKIHLILDRGPYNISAYTKEAAEKYRIKLHYLPPYSPNLNPIERLWKVMNEYARNSVSFKDAKAFRTAIMTFFHKTWPQIAASMVDRINDNFQLLKSAV
jgi:transposase